MIKKSIKKLLSNLYVDYIAGVSLISLLDAIIVFLIVRMVTFLMSTRKFLPPLFGVSSDLWIALLIGIIAFAFQASKRARRYSIRDVENRVPALSEMLTTIKDTIKMDNPVIDEFRKDVIKTARNASSAGIIPLKGILTKLLVVFLLGILFGFLPLLSPFLNFLPTDIPLPDDFLYLKQFHGQIDAVEIKDDDSIFGNSTIMQQLENDLEITVDLSIGGGDLSNPMAWQNNPKKDSLAYKGGVSAVIDNPAIEELPIEYELAKAYNLKIKKLK
jgi:hypothetical protein